MTRYRQFFVKHNIWRYMHLTFTLFVCLMSFKTINTAHICKQKTHGEDNLSDVLRIEYETKIIVNLINLWAYKWC